MEHALQPECEAQKVSNVNDSQVDDLLSEDSRLVARCLAGDERAFEELISSYQSLVFNLSFRMLNNREEAEDLTQEVFIKVSRSLRSFRGHSTLKTWIYRITVNMSLNRIKYHKRRKKNQQVSIHFKKTVESPALEDRLEDNSPSPERLSKSKQINARLQKALDNLNDNQRTVVILRDIQGLSYDEIAETMSINIGTVKSRLARGRSELQQMLKDLL